MTDDTLNRTGFFPCEFGPSAEDECEKCDAVNVQLYAARTDYWEREYDTWCGDCVIAWSEYVVEEDVRIDALMKTTPAQAGNPTAEAGK